MKSIYIPLYLVTEPTVTRLTSERYPDTQQNHQ